MPALAGGAAGGGKRRKGCGSCHKCSASLEETSKFAECPVCNCRYHTFDCGGRIAIIGKDVSLAVQCPRCSQLCLCTGGEMKCHVGAQKRKRAESAAAKSQRRQEQFADKQSKKAKTPSSTTTSASGGKPLPGRAVASPVSCVTGSEGVKSHSGMSHGSVTQVGIDIGSTAGSPELGAGAHVGGGEGGRPQDHSRSSSGAGSSDLVVAPAGREFDAYSPQEDQHTVLHLASANTSPAVTASSGGVRGPGGAEAGDPPGARVYELPAAALRQMGSLAGGLHGFVDRPGVGGGGGGAGGGPARGFVGRPLDGLGAGGAGAAARPQGFVARPLDGGPLATGPAPLDAPWPSVFPLVKAEPVPATFGAQAHPAPGGFAPPDEMIVQISEEEIKSIMDSEFQRAEALKDALAAPEEEGDGSPLSGPSDVLSKPRELSKAAGGSGSGYSSDDLDVDHTSTLVDPPMFSKGDMDDLVFLDPSPAELGGGSSGCGGDGFIAPGRGGARRGGGGVRDAFLDLDLRVQLGAFLGTAVASASTLLVLVMVVWGAPASWDGSGLPAGADAYGGEGGGRGGGGGAPPDGSGGSRKTDEPPGDGSFEQTASGGSFDVSGDVTSADDAIPVSPPGPGLPVGVRTGADPLPLWEVVLRSAVLALLAVACVACVAGAVYVVWSRRRAARKAAVLARASEGLGRRGGGGAGGGRADGSGGKGGKGAATSPDLVVVEVEGGLKVVSAAA